MLLIVGALLVLMAIVVIGMALVGERGSETGVARALAALESMGGGDATPLTDELDRPFSERILEPLQARALRVGRRFTGNDSSDRVRHKLDLAGNPKGWSVDRVVAMRVLGTPVGVVLAIVIGVVLDLSLPVRIGAVVLGAFLGYSAVGLWLYQIAHNRQEKLSKGLPDAIDLLTISVESGLAFDAALQQVADKTTGPLAEEFSRVLREMQIGQGRGAALRSFAERSNLQELRSFVSALVQADAFGIPIGQVLRIQSQEMRVKRRQKAEEKAQQVPVKMTIPLIFFILPCLFLIVMGPAAISILENGLGG